MRLGGWARDRNRPWLFLLGARDNYRRWALFAGATFAKKFQSWWDFHSFLFFWLRSCLIKVSIRPRLGSQVIAVSGIRPAIKVSAAFPETPSQISQNASPFIEKIPLETFIAPIPCPLIDLNECAAELELLKMLHGISGLLISSI